MNRGLVGALALGLSVVFGCGKTNAPEHDNTGGNGPRGGETAMTDAGEGNGASPSNGGAGGVAGKGGSGGKLPDDGDIPPAVATNKLDLLVMVDNSRNTLEKQRYLADAVGWLLAADGAGVAATDIHVGFVTSSLGSHGAQGAKDVCVTVDDNDHAHLLATLRNTPSYQNSGFLAWGPSSQSDRALLVSQVQPSIDAATEHGCGYEASLEAWYRFLVEPDPYESVVVPGGDSRSVGMGTDATLLAQRQAFLRPDSVLAIVVMSDENDCSIQDQGYGWLIARSAAMYRSTSACKNPNDPCCQSCGEAAANDGCPAIASDSECMKGPSLAAEEDSLNVRCWDQKRRFGFDLLYPIQRYTDGLTRQFVFDRNGQVQRNPLFAGEGAARRHPSQVILAGIVGVPWQDLADADSLMGPALTNLTAAGLRSEKRWQLMLGDPSASPPVPPTDPFMLETTTDRSTLAIAQQHPITGFSLVSSSSTNPRANPINGHETADVSHNGLQTACAFPLKTPVSCDQAALDADIGCLCFDDDIPRNSALCQSPQGGPAGTMQYMTDVFPGGRHLQLLESLGDGAVVGSACPKIFEDQARADYGYRPVMKGLADRINGALAP